MEQRTSRERCHKCDDGLAPWKPGDRVFICDSLINRAGGKKKMRCYAFRGTEAHPAWDHSIKAARTRRVGEECCCGAVSVFHMFDDPKGRWPWTGCFVSPGDHRDARVRATIGEKA